MNWQNAVAATALVVGIAFAGQVVWLEIERPHPVVLPPLENNSNNMPAIPVEGRTYEIDPALKSLFGELRQPEIDIASLPDTELDLVLQGIIAHADPARTSTIIKYGEESRRFYSGERVADATILSIEPNLVILEREREREVLRFPRLNFDVPETRSQTADGMGDDTGAIRETDTTIDMPADERFVEDSEEHGETEQPIGLAERLRRIRSLENQ